MEKMGVGERAGRRRRAKGGEKWEGRRIGGKGEGRGGKRGKMGEGTGEEPVVNEGGVPTPPVLSRLEQQRQLACISVFDPCGDSLGISLAHHTPAGVWFSAELSGRKSRRGASCRMGRGAEVPALDKCSLDTSTHSHSSGSRSMLSIEHVLSSRQYLKQIWSRDTGARGALTLPKSEPSSPTALKSFCEDCQGSTVPTESGRESYRK